MSKTILIRLNPEDVGVSRFREQNGIKITPDKRVQRGTFFMLVKGRATEELENAETAKEA